MEGLARRLRALFDTGGFDVLWLEKEVLPWVPYCIERLALGRRARYVADYDDAIFHNYDLNANPVIRRVLGTKIARVMAEARLVIVGNQYLGRYAELAGATRVEVLPTVVDLTKYPMRTPGRNGGFTVGWIGTPTTSQYLYQVSSALGRVCRELGTRIMLVGSGPIRLEGMPVEIHTWLEDTEQDKVAAFDIGIMPLPDEPWQHGKCGYKLIQYMACGKPVIASPVGANREIVEHGKNGFLASTQEEWFEYLRLLTCDRRMRLAMGAEGRSKVEREYSVQVTAPRLASCLREAAEAS
jgi:glycosyltransferase involved in cell wall biosynthesis